MTRAPPESHFYAPSSRGPCGESHCQCGQCLPRVPGPVTPRAPYFPSEPHQYSSSSTSHKLLHSEEACRACRKSLNIGSLNNNNNDSSGVPPSPSVVLVNASKVWSRRSLLIGVVLLLVGESLGSPSGGGGGVSGGGGGSGSYFSPQGSLLGGSEEASGGGAAQWERANTCLNIPQNFTLCKNIGYRQMMIPNLLGHDSLQEAEYHAKSWVPLLGLQCHADTQLFLCSLFSPICLDRPIYPCRSLCQGVQAKCEPRMLAYNYPWPSMLKCDQFPEDHDLCIKPGAANSDNAEKIDEPDCPSCNQAHTCENIVDHFCRADFVFRAKFKRSRGSSVEFRRGKWFKPREGRKVRTEFKDLSLDHKDNCCTSKLRPGAPYIVMGVKKGDTHVPTFVMQWNGNDKILKNAIKTFRSMDCSNPLPMSVGAEDGGRNSSSSVAGGRRTRRRGQRQRQGRNGHTPSTTTPTSYGGCRATPTTTATL